MSYRVLMIAPTSFFLDYGSHVRIREEARILQQSHHRIKIVTYPLGRDLSDLDIERALKIPWTPRHEVGPASSKLILDVLLGDPPLFPRHQEVELSWKILDPIEEFWATQGQPEQYRPGTWGPASADELLARDGRVWRRP